MNTATAARRCIVPIACSPRGRVAPAAAPPIVSSGLLCSTCADSPSVTHEPLTGPPSVARGGAPCVCPQLRSRSGAAPRQWRAAGPLLLPPLPLPPPHAAVDRPPHSAPGPVGREPRKGLLPGAGCVSRAGMHVQPRCAAAQRTAGGHGARCVCACAVQHGLQRRNALRSWGAAAPSTPRSPPNRPNVCSTTVGSESRRWTLALHVLSCDEQGECRTFDRNQVRLSTVVQKLRCGATAPPSLENRGSTSRGKFAPRCCGVGTVLSAGGEAHATHDRGVGSRGARRAGQDGLPGAGCPLTRCHAAAMRTVRGIAWCGGNP